jgi:hypothetical protein
MNKISNYIKVVCIAVMLLIVIASVYYYHETSKYKELYLRELTNVKAYQSENNELKGQSVVHLLTIDQLKASKDSADIALKNTLDKLKIKPKNVVSIGSVTSNIEKRDSIFFTDTIFLSKVNLDTLFGDRWYKAQLGLHYPSRIDLSVSVPSVKSIIVHNKRETVNLPSKFWLFRLFQKKHTVTIVEITEENPYIEAGSQRFIQVTK